METPQPHETPEGIAVDLGRIYRYDTKKGIRYVLSSWRKDGSPRGFMISRDKVHEKIDKLLDSLDASAASKPSVPGKASAKWSGKED